MRLVISPMPEYMQDRYNRLLMYRNVSILNYLRYYISDDIGMIILDISKEILEGDDEQKQDRSESISR